jgi:chromosome segregation ATPase
MAEYIEDICAEKHKRIEEKLGVHDTRLNNHSERIDKLEQYQSRTEAQITSLCEQIKNLVTTMRWFMGLLVGSFVSFFFYAVQHGIFK